MVNTSVYILLLTINIFLIESTSGNPCPSVGTVQLQLDNFMGFANEPVGSQRRGNSVNIRGISWQLGVELTESAEDGTKYLGMNLYCGNNCSIDTNWNCFSMMEFRVIVGEYNVYSKKIKATNFNAHNTSIGAANFIKIKNLTEMCRFANENTVKLFADVMPDQPCGNSLPRTDAVLVKTNDDNIGTEVKINRNLLAAHSTVFNDLFNHSKPAAESSSSNGGWSVQIEPPSNVEHFAQMIDVLHLGDYALDDENLENVLRLALQFQLGDVVSKCGRFLGSLHCEIPTMKKYHIADKYELNALKNFILHNLLQQSDFDGPKFAQNLEIYEQLSDEAKAQLKLRVVKLFLEGQTNVEN